VTYRIHRSTQSGTSVFAVSGVLNTEHVAALRELLTSEGDVRVVLDLQDITLVDRKAVRFLAEVELAGADIINCPEYVRSWISAEHGTE
jgi:anti-anti-sigma regulatory factor